MRELELSKLRGTRLPQFTFMFTLEGGFHILTPFSAKMPKEVGKWKPIPDSETRFSTGSQDLDRVLSGGYPKGSYIVLEADTNVPLDAIRLFELPLALNFLSQGRGVCIMPSGGTDSKEVRELTVPYLEEGVFDKYARVYEEMRPGKDQLKPYIALMRGGATNLERDSAAWAQVQVGLRESTGQPVLSLIGCDMLESRYAENPEKLFGEMGLMVLECRAQGNLSLAVARSGLRITQRMLNMVDIHLRLIERHGCILLLGVKPRVGIYAIDCDVSNGYPTLMLIPMV